MVCRIEGHTTVCSGSAAETVVLLCGVPCRTHAPDSKHSPRTKPELQPIPVRPIKHSPSPHAVPGLEHKNVSDAVPAWNRFE